VVGFKLRKMHGRSWWKSFAMNMRLRALVR